ncbi:MAG: hypothetical protein HY275_17555 [Gemmatimonadetes bacterium]|nr:hypothetical protein [Gemmatimonadota bacterium]
MTRRVMQFLIPGALALAIASSIAGGQSVANTSAQATALGGTYTASARGFDAIGWNPAGLAMPGTGGFAFTLALNAGGYGGSGPISGKDLKPFSGDSIPYATRVDWLNRIRAAGGQTFGGGVDLTALSMNIGSVGLSYSIAGRASGNLPPDAAELLLFGNYGFANAVRPYTLQGARLDVSAIGTAAFAYGREFNVRFGSARDQHFALGVTAKYLMGHALGVVVDGGSNVASAPAVNVDVRLRQIVSDTGNSKGGLPMAGNGIGFDVGAAWQGGPLKIGVAVRDIANTFKWTPSEMFTRMSTVKYTNGQQSQVDGVWTKVSASSAAAQDSVTQALNPLVINPQLAVGLAYELPLRFTVSGEYQQRFGDGIAVAAKSRYSAGLQWKIIPFLPIRAGYAQTPDATFLTGGVGLDFGLVRLDLAGGVNTKTSGDGVGHVALTFGRH